MPSIVEQGEQRETKSGNATVKERIVSFEVGARALHGYHVTREQGRRDSE